MQTRQLSTELGSSPSTTKRRIIRMGVRSFLAPAALTRRGLDRATLAVVERSQPRGRRRFCAGCRAVAGTWVRWPPSRRSNIDRPGREPKNGRLRSPGRPRLRPTLHNDGSDDDTSLGHGRPPATGTDVLYVWRQVSSMSRTQTVISLGLSWAHAAGYRRRRFTIGGPCGGERNLTTEKGETANPTIAT